MAYIESTTMSRKDWPAVFQRQTASPLDRSSIFKSYASAYVYASLGTLKFSDLNNIDGFKKESDATYWSSYTDDQVTSLGACAYVGQIITVYGTGYNSSEEEIAAYIITGVGETPSLVKLAQTAIVGGDVDSAIQTINTQISTLSQNLTALESRVGTLEGKEDKNTEYTFTTATTTDGAIKVTPTGGTAQEVQVKGWSDLNQKIEDVTQVAAGRTKSYVYEKPDTKAFQDDAKKTNFFKVGDIIYFTEKSIPDYWVGEILTTADETTGYFYKFYDLEVTKVDLEPYATKTHVSDTYVAKADFDVDNYNTYVEGITLALGEIDENFKEIGQKIGTVEQSNDAQPIPLQSQIGSIKKNDDGTPISLQSQIDNIDVSGQISSKINEFKDTLTLSAVGDDTGDYYISSISQNGGKVTATKHAMPNVAEIAEEKAGIAESAAKEYAKEYADTLVGDIGNSADVVSFVTEAIGDTSDILTDAIEAVAEKLEGTDGKGGLTARVKVIEDADYQAQINTINNDVIGTDATAGTVKGRLKAVEGVASDAQTRVGTLEGTVSTLSGTVSGHTTAINNLNTAVAGRVKEIQLGGVKQTMTAEGVVNITGISTDLLSQGSKTLVLDCLNAALDDTY